MEIIIEQPTVPVYMTAIDVELFKKFQKHHKLFKLLVERGVFDQKNANIMLNFDANGTLASIERHDFLYSSRFDMAKAI